MANARSQFVRRFALTIALIAANPAMAVDLTALWDFNQPELSEKRFKQALQTASGDDALILHTQVARTQGLRKNFDAARQILLGIKPKIANAGPQAQIRFHLEMGRTFASATHAPAQLTADARAQARQAYELALNLARAAGMDGLAVDAIHMFAFLDTSAADQLKWGQAALEVVQASSQPDAKRWEASVRHNTGYALHQLGRFEEALAQFQQALVLRQAGDNANATHVAHWMIGWTLRSLKRNSEAMAIQLRLEQSADAANKPDHHVFAELEILFTDAGDVAKANHYARRKQASSPP
jgi:tetratricopeptide (TPR) repeat protein